jgi:hypothetical protein
MSTVPPGATLALITAPAGVTTEQNRSAARNRGPSSDLNELKRFFDKIIVPPFTYKTKETHFIYFYHLI